MPPRKPRPRTAARARTRAHQQLVRDLEHLARLEPGGTPDRPLPIESSAQVEPIATSHPCPLCQGPLHLQEHAAQEIDGTLLRVARLRCTSCGVARERWFRLSPPSIN